MPGALRPSLLPVPKVTAVNLPFSEDRHPDPGDGLDKRAGKFLDRSS